MKIKKTNTKYIIGINMICPKTKKHCYDECCPVGSICNLYSIKEELTQEKNDNNNNLYSNIFTIINNKEIEILLK